MADKTAPDFRATIASRFTVVALVFAFWTVAIVGRLFFLQVVSYDDLVARALRQQMHTAEAPAKRGEIYDRNGRLLAYSVDADTIYAVPSEMSDIPAAAAAICKVLEGCDRKERPPQPTGRRFARCRQEVNGIQ